MTEASGVKYTLEDLAKMSILDVDALQSMYAAEMMGQAFYMALANRFDDPQAAELLRRNGREEAGHARRIGRAIAIKQGAEFEPVDYSDQPDFPLPEVIGREMLESVLKGEIAGDVGYQKWASREPNPEVARLYRLNGREEGLHGQRVQQVLDILANA
jgi:rubrerythrin